QGVSRRGGGGRRGIFGGRRRGRAGGRGRGRGVHGGRVGPGVPPPRTGRPRRAAPAGGPRAPGRPRRGGGGGGPRPARRRGGRGGAVPRPRSAPGSTRMRRASGSPSRGGQVVPGCLPYADGAGALSGPAGVAGWVARRGRGRALRPLRAEEASREVSAA